MITSIKKRSLIRDFAVYAASSLWYLLLRGEFILFSKDISAFPQWRKFRTSSGTTIDNRIPWITFEAIVFLRNWLRPDMIVYEYGSGGSTLFFSDHVKEVYSIEHDPDWFNKLKRVIDAEQNLKIHYQHYPAEPLLQKSDNLDPADPVNYLSCMGKYQDLSFEHYVKSIDRFKNDFFDLIVVDGRARPSCILHSIKKIKQNGALLVDNTDRGYYLESFPELFNKTKWKHLEYKGHTPYGLTSVLYKTTIFIKK